VTSPWPEAALEPEPEPEPRSEPESEPELPPPGPDLGFEPALEFARDPAHEPAPEPSPEPAECAPEIAAELGALAAHETLSEPELRSRGRGVRDVVRRSPLEFVAAPEVRVQVPKPEAQPTPALAPGRAMVPDAERPDPDPAHDPVRGRRGLDATSLVVGVTTTLVLMGLGFAVWSYTATRSLPASEAARTRNRRSSTLRQRSRRPDLRRSRRQADRETGRDRETVERRKAPPAPKPVSRAPLAAPIVALARSCEPAPTPSAAPSVPPHPTRRSSRRACRSRSSVTPAVERFLTAWLGVRDG
jgi:hypothetical protein